MLYLESIRRKSVIHSWDATAMNGPVTRCNKIILEQLPMILSCAIWLSKTEQTKVLEIVTVVLSAIRSFVIVDNAYRLIQGDLTLSKIGGRKCDIRYVIGVSDFKIDFNITFQIQSFTPNNTKITFDY